LDSCCHLVLVIDTNYSGKMNNTGNATTVRGDIFIRVILFCPANTIRRFWIKQCEAIYLCNYFTAIKIYDNLLSYQSFVCHYLAHAATSLRCSVCSGCQTPRIASRICSGVPSSQSSGVVHGTAWERRFASFQDGRRRPVTIFDNVV